MQEIKKFKNKYLQTGNDNSGPDEVTASDKPSQSSQRDEIFAEIAKNVLSEDEKAALDSVKGDFAARMVAAQRPAVKSAVVLKRELSGHDPDFLSGIHNQLGSLSVTKDGSAAGYSFVRSVLKEASPRNTVETMLVTQMLAMHDATMALSKSLGEAKTLEQVNSYGNLLNKSARTFADQYERLHRCRSGPETKLNVSVNDGGQAMFGYVSHNTDKDKHKADAAKPAPPVFDQSGTAMPISQRDEPSTMTDPRIERDRQPAPSPAKRKRRA